MQPVWWFVNGLTWQGLIYGFATMLWGLWWGARFG